MNGIQVKRYCPNCKKDVVIHMSASFFVDGEHYYKDLFCYICETDLSKEDRRILEEAKKRGKFISVTMH